MSMSNFLENEVVHYFLRSDANVYAQPANLYLALFTSDPGDSGSTASEVTQATNSYARQIITFGAPTNGATSNDAVVNFTDMPAVTVTHFGIFDAVTYQGGNMLYYGQLDLASNMLAGGDISAPVGSIIITHS